LSPATKDDFIEGIARILQIEESKDTTGTKAIFNISITGNCTYMFRDILSSLKSASFEYNAASESYEALSKTTAAKIVEQELKNVFSAYKNVSIKVK